MNRSDADKALKALEGLDGPPQLIDAVGRFIHDVREQLPQPHQPFGSKEAQEAYERQAEETREVARKGATS